MGKEQNDIDIDDIVIEEIGIQEIDDRNKNLLKEEDSLGGTQSAEENAAGTNTERHAADTAAEVSAGDDSDYDSGMSVHAEKDTANDDEVYDDEDEDDEDDEDEETGHSRRTKGDYVRYGIMFIALCVLVYAGYSLVSIFLEYRAGEQIYDELAQYAAATEAPSEEGYVQEYIDEEYPLNPNFTPAVVDWDSLAAQNADICGWIQFESDNLKEQINYPIVHGTDNTYYLTHAFTGEENSAGSIFIETKNSTDFSDMNTIIYGHNMKNGSMFGLLRYYKEASYYEGNEYFWIYTPQGNYRYKIFSCYEPMADSETYTWWSGPCDAYTQYLENVQSYSKYETGVNVKATDHIVTLSTCTSRGSDYRFVIHAKLVYSEVSAATAGTATEASE